jgi:hypothetical protein
MSKLTADEELGRSHAALQQENRWQRQGTGSSRIPQNRRRHGLAH